MDSLDDLYQAGIAKRRAADQGFGRVVEGFNRGVDRYVGEPLRKGIGYGFGAEDFLTPAENESRNLQLARRSFQSEGLPTDELDRRSAAAEGAIAAERRANPNYGQATIDDIFGPAPQERRTADSSIGPPEPAAQSPAEQYSGSGKVERATEKFSEPPRVSQSEYGALRRNQQFGGPINVDPLSMSLADLEGDQRTRDLLRERHHGRLEDIALDASMRPDPAEETRKAQAEQRAYERGLPASLSDMNRLGASGLTRGEAMAEDLYRGRQQQQADLYRPRLENAREVAILSHPPKVATPGQMNQSEANEHAATLQRFLQDARARGVGDQEANALAMRYINEKAPAYADSLIRRFFPKSGQDMPLR